MRRSLILVSVAALVFAACAKEGRIGPQTLEVSATDYAFASPARVPSGATQITLSNDGAEAHQAQLVRLRGSATVAELVTAAKSTDPSAVSKLAADAGGPGGIDPEATQVATVDLEAGRYAFICVIPDAKGRSHLALGMASELTVTDDGGTHDLPFTQDEAALSEFDFDLPATWGRPVTVRNPGAQPHEFQILGVRPGATVEQFLAFFKGPEDGPPPAGPPPFTAEGGTAVMAPGDANVVTVDLQPGTYFAMCFVPDLAKKAPHFALGMLKQFEVR